MNVARASFRSRMAVESLGAGVPTLPLSHKPSGLPPITGSLRMLSSTASSPQSPPEPEPEKKASAAAAAAFGPPEPPKYERWSQPWWKEQAIVFTIFSITGSSCMLFVRPMLGLLDITGSMLDGPWSYRLASVFLITPCYSVLLFLFASLLGRSAWGKWFVFKMWRRILPGPALQMLAKLMAP